MNASLAVGRVVTGHDGSQASEEALGWAAALAERLGRPLVVAHAVHLPSPPTSGQLAGAPWYTQELLEDVVDHARSESGMAVERIRQHHHRVDISVVAGVGSPAQFLLETAGPGDLLVVGRQGTTGRGRRFLGSVADEVVTHATTPVVVVPAGATLGDDSAPVVVGLDGHSSQRARSFAVALASRLERPLVAASVLDALVPAGMQGQRDMADRARVVHQAALAEELALEHGAGGDDPGMTSIVLEGRAAEQLAKAARDASLLVVGSRGRGGFHGLLLGSTSRTLTSSAEVPVLVVREPSPGADPISHGRAA